MVGRHTQTRQRRLRRQNSKILVTAGTIKRPLPCPVEEREKRRIFHNIKKKKENRVRREEKD